MPSAMSRPIDPEGTATTSVVSAPSFRRMMEPLPYSFSMEATASSMAFWRFLLSSMGPPILGLCSVVNLCGCDDEKKPHEVQPASPSAIANALGIDAATLGGQLVDPEKPAGDLAADVASFTTVEACMKQRTATLDPLVGDAVDAIGYDTFLRDACRVLEAAKTKDPKKCELIDASALRARCRAVTAMVSGDADGCPLKAPSKPDLGRDATCVAIALRSPAMCEGAQRRDRPACEATVLKDAKKCDAIPLDDLRALCTRDAARFRGVIVGSAAISSVPQAKATLTIHGEGTPDPAQASADLDSDVGSGVVVVLDGKKTRVSFGRLGEVSATPHAAQPLDRTRLALQFTTVDGSAAGGTSRTQPIEINEATLTVPGAPAASCTAERCTLTVKIDKLEPKRGGVVTLTLDGSLGGYKIHADVSTFVRDVVQSTSLH